MTTLWQSGKTVVTRLRVRCSGIDPISAQLRVTSLFNAAHVHPVGLPPSAIICIRKLLDPQPGTLRIEPGSVRPPLAWEQAVAASLHQLVRRAVRPARGAVPTDAEAVIFLDRSELLACLASDWCDGSAVAHWWWQSLFKGAGSARAVLDAWLDMPAYIPAALQHMAKSGQAVPFVRTLSINHARALLQSITRSFALHDLQSVLKAVLDESGREMHSEVKTLKFEEEARQLDPPPSAFNTPPSAPWQSWVPESESAGLGLEHQCLLGIGLMLQRAPMVVRTQSFTRAVLQWRQAMEQSGSSGTFKAATGLVTAYESGRLPTNFSKAIVDENNAFTPVAKPPTAERVVSLELLPVEQGLGAAHVPLSSPAAPMVRMTHAVLAPQPPDSGILPMSELHQMRLASHEQGMVSTGPSPSVNQGPDAITLPEAHITTALGGVFYLINLGLFLGIYGDFTTPAHPGLPLPVWDFVALLGQQLLGEKMRADPVWALLADLAGRSAQQAPGNGFDPPDAWRMPEEWLEPFHDAGLWQWNAAHGRLWVKHPEHFWVLDVPRNTGDPMQQLQRVLQDYRRQTAFELHRGALECDVRSAAPLERWLGWLMPYVHARLQRALGVADTDELARVLCEHQARVYVTATHVDIFLALEALPIAIRLAGLDRDPGWVPAAGRYIAFHFE